MRVVVQRVSEAAVSWHDESDASRTHTSQIRRGLAILVGAGPDDDDRVPARLAEKVAQLRIFPDQDGRMNRSLEDVGGEALVVSQFTLYADTSKGRRPSYLRAGDPGRAEALCEAFAEALRARGVGTVTGSFGAHMQVSLVNEGPVTLVLSTDDWATRISG